MIYDEDESSSGSEEWESEDSSSGERASGRHLAERGRGSSQRDSELSSGSVATCGVMRAQPRGTLRLDKTQARAGDVVGVYWDIPTVQSSAGDWIAVYEKGKRSPSLPPSLPPFLSTQTLYHR